MSIPAIHMTDGAEPINQRAVQEVFRRADPEKVATYLIERARLGGLEGPADELSLHTILEYCVIARRNEIALIPVHILDEPHGFKKIFSRLLRH